MSMLLYKKPFIIISKVRNKFNYIRDRYINTNYVRTYTPNRILKMMKSKSENNTKGMREKQGERSEV